MHLFALIMGIMMLHHNSRSKKPDTYLINHQIGQPEIFWQIRSWAWLPIFFITKCGVSDLVAPSIW